VAIAQVLRVHPRDHSLVSLGRTLEAAAVSISLEQDCLKNRTIYVLALRVVTDDELAGIVRYTVQKARVFKSRFK